MALATDAEPRREASGCTSDHSAEMTPSHQAELEFSQRGPAMLAAVDELVGAQECQLCRPSDGMA